jgi:hypothetical protein
MGGMLEAEATEEFGKILCNRYRVLLCGGMLFVDILLGIFGCA